MNDFFNHIHKIFLAPDSLLSIIRGKGRSGNGNFSLTEWKILNLSFRWLFDVFYRNKEETSLKTNLLNRKNRIKLKYRLF